MNSNKKQVIVIHGGNTFDTYEEYIADLKAEQVDLDDLTPPKRWKDALGPDLGFDFQVLQPEMPNFMNAKYAEWKIWFDKFAPLFNDEVVLIGHSLGGIFLAKYLSETQFPKKILATFLVAAPYRENGEADSLGDFAFSGNFDLLEKQSGVLFIYHSKDDQIVDYSNALRYKEKLPKAKLVMFEHENHFFQTEFPEIEENIKNAFTS